VSREISTELMVLCSESCRKSVSVRTEEKRNGNSLDIRVCNRNAMEKCM
jgi:hypothetical protein